MAAKRNRARVQPGSVKSRQQAKLNSQRAQKAPIKPAGVRSPVAQPVDRVRVKDVTPPPKALPPAKPRLPAGKPGGALSTRGAASATAAARSRAAGPIAGAIGAMAGNALSPLAYKAGQAAGTAIRDFNRPAPGTPPARSKADLMGKGGARATDPATTGRYIPGRDQVKFDTPKPPAPKPRGNGSGSTSSRSSSRGSSSSPSRPPAPAPKPSTPKPPTPAASSPKKDLTINRDYIDQKSGTGTAGPNMGIPQYTDKNGIDTDRRRAFLDAKDSLSGMKAVRKLMEERKKKASGK